MEIMKIFLSGLIATSVMTAFSYILAEIRDKQFREPELLNMLLSRSDLFRLKLSKNSIAGWILHYLIGWMFVILFEVIWSLEIFSFSTLISGVILGFIAGIIGIFSWKFMFWISKNPPKITWSEYYIQLIIAHILFGISAAIFYELW